jgi:hypothetical protein
MHMCYINVIRGLKARIMEPAETTITRERPCKRHVTAGYRRDRSNTTIKKLWEDVFSMQSAAMDT